MDSSLTSANCGFSRRNFIKNTSEGLLAATLGGGATVAGFADDKSPTKPIAKAERLVRELYASLDDHQRSRIVLPYDHELRGRVESNWHIRNDRIGSVFDRNQQKLIADIFLDLHSDEFRARAWDQFIGDNRTKKSRIPDEVFGTASIALFTTPDLENIEFVFTGRHCTRRCDGNASEGVAFGGPIFYGHAAKGFYEKPDHPGNVFWYQAKHANALFEMLDPKQREIVLKGDSRGENGSRTVDLKEGKNVKFDGMPAYEMTSDQREELMKVVGDLLLPFRKEDQERALKMIKAQLNDIHLAFYKNEDVGDDQVWDTWQLESPSMIWYFRGDPHVHTWVHVKLPPENTSKKPA